jgi:hypothetical protein
MKGNEAMPQIIKSARRLSLSIAWTVAVVVACATGSLGKAHAQTKIVEGMARCNGRNTLPANSVGSRKTVSTWICWL